MSGLAEAITEADLILPRGADRPEWLAARNTGIGSSDSSAVLGVSPYRDARDVWLDKTGRGSDLAESEPMRWGNLLEPVVMAEFSQRAQVGTELTGTWRSRKWPWLVANPDGLTDDGGGIEIKTAGARQADDWDGQIPDHAEVQAQHCMAVLGLPHWWVAGLVGGQRLVWQRITRDDTLVDLIVDRTQDLWSCVELDVPPPGANTGEWAAARYRIAEAGKAVALDAAQALQLRAAYQEAAANQSADKAAFVAAQNAVREAMGDAESAVCGEDVIATWDHTGKFDEDAFRAAHPDIAADFTTTVEVIDRARLAAVHPHLFRDFRGRVLRVKG